MASSQIRAALEDIEMGGNPGKTTPPKKGGGTCTPGPTNVHDKISSPDELHPTPTKKGTTLPTKPAGPPTAGKPKNGPATAGNTSTYNFNPEIPKTNHNLRPKPAKQPANRILFPESMENPMKKSNKRTKRPASEMQSPEHVRPSPQKSTGSASKAEERQWLENALGFVTKAHNNTPMYSEIIRALETAIQGKTYQSFETRAEMMLQKLEKQLGGTSIQTTNVPKSTKPTTQSYAAVTKGTVKPQAVTTKKTPKVALDTAPKKTVSTTPTVKNTQNPQQLVLITQKNQALPTYSPMAIRDAINASIIKEGKAKGPMVGSVTTSSNKNIVLTTISPYNAEMLNNVLPTWKQTFEGFPITTCQVQKPWIKLVAHGIPIEAGDQFQAEGETFNPIRVKGKTRWLKKPTKPAGSIVFAVESQEEQRHCLSNGLLIAGKRVIVVNFKTHSQYSQCFRCQGFGHDPAKCKKRVACKLCAGKHLTKSHTCTVCKASTECTHTEIKCANCGGKHIANSRDCEILKAVRGVDKNRPENRNPPELS